MFKFVDSSAPAPKAHNVPLRSSRGDPEVTSFRLSTMPHHPLAIWILIGYRLYCSLIRSVGSWPSQKCLYSPGQIASILLRTKVPYLLWYLNNLPYIQLLLYSHWNHLSNLSNTLLDRSRNRSHGFVWLAELGGQGHLFTTVTRTSSAQLMVACDA